MNLETNISTTDFSAEKKAYSLSMLEEMDDNEYLLDMLTILVTETPQDLQKMLEAARAEDYDTVCKKAHILKSTGGIIQAERFVNMIHAIEADAKLEHGGDLLINQIQKTVELFTIIENELKIRITKL